MASKSGKDKKNTDRKTPAADKQIEKTSSKPKTQLEEDEDDLDEDDDVAVKPSSSAKTIASPKKSSEDDDDDDDDDAAENEVDDWDKPEEEDTWDPDFEEFDIPKSRGKKSSNGTAKKGGSDEDDLGLDEDFKEFDLFNDSELDEEEEDDF
jgi:DNA-directed RNA polymerase subunit delta